MCSYFNPEFRNDTIDKKLVNIISRKNRVSVPGFFSLRFFVGDIIKIICFIRNVPLVFEGVCISISKRKFILPDVSFILRNVILSVGIEINISYYYNRVYTLKLHDFKRKIFFFRRSKLFFLRFRLNKESRVI